MYKILLDLIKKSIWPASLMVFGKALGLYLAIRIFDLDLYISNDVTSKQSVQFFFADSNDTLLANSFSNAVMFGAVLLGTLYLIIHFYYVQLAEKEPSTVVKLVKINLLSLITEKKHNLIQLVTWLAFLFVAGITVLRDTIITINYQWLGAVIGSLLLVILIIGIKLIEKELNKIYPMVNYEKI